LLDIVPSSTIPFLVLGTPFLGFSAITTPEVTLEYDEIKEMNSMFKRGGYSGGSVGSITLSRGVKGYDDTMWQWMKRAIQGNDMTNRNLLLVQFTSIGTTEDELGVGAWESAAFLPGKAWILWSCVPTRYKAGTDFDATSGEVSIAELEIQPWSVNEVTLLSPL
jgi:phage tail-like protein